MFSPINRSSRQESGGADSALHSYISMLSSTEKDAWPRLFRAVIEKKSADECDKKTLFNAVLQADVESLDVSRADSLLGMSREAFFLLTEKLIDAKRIVFATKMMNLARKESILPNKYFRLRRRLKVAVRCMYTAHMHIRVDKPH